MRKLKQLSFGLYKLSEEDAKKILRENLILKNIIESDLIRCIKVLAQKKKGRAPTFREIEIFKNYITIAPIKTLIYKMNLFKGSYNNALLSAGLRTNRKSPKK